MALLTAGILWMLDMADVTAVGPLRILSIGLSIGLAIVGLGLLVGSIAGRGRSLIIAGVILLPLVLVGSLLRGFPSMDLVVGPGGSFGQVVEAPLTVQEVESSYELGAGEFLLDLSGVEFEPGRDVRTSIQLGAGELVVTVPDDVDVVVNARVGAGELQVFDQVRAGVGIRLDRVDRVDGGDGSDLAAPAADPAVLTIDLNAGFADVTIDRNDRSPATDSTPPSFIFGALFVAVAAVGLIDRELLAVTDLRWIAPGLLVALGALLLVLSGRRAVADGGDAGDGGGAGGGGGAVDGGGADDGSPDGVTAASRSTHSDAAVEGDDPER